MAPTNAHSSAFSKLSFLTTRRPNLLTRNALPYQSLTQSSALSPIEASKILTARSESTNKIVHGQGAIPPGAIRMEGLMALFAIIGAAFVIAGIWFFFWAKNGGFHWSKNDWEDYKSTVLRRKDANGKLLSNATASTNLGGGSVVAGTYYDDDGETGTVTATNVDTETVASGEKPKKKRKGFRETAKEKFLRKQKEETWEGGHDNDMRAYRHEKPAKVGGMNREADGTYHGSEFTSTNDQRSEWTQSEAGHTHQQEYYQPYDQPDAGKKRNVSGFSFAPGTEDTISQVMTEEREPLRKNPSHRHHRSHSRQHSEDQGKTTTRSRTSQRPRGPRVDAASSTTSASRSRQSSPRKQNRAMPGGYTEPLDMSEYSYHHVDQPDTGSGTLSYHHPIPALSKGYRRAGGRNGRRDSLSDSDGDEYSRAS
ncbi:hypothetical protein FQN57_005942 [Myotisia sp. PD_48]|nr:hypothetical protein FQN57_005942 [Myotisia sp. PD_48]